MSAADDRRPDGNTVYEIGSISKVFTGILLADAVHRGEVGLEQSLETLLPTNGTPEYRLGPISLRHLATHTSGLPRLPNNMRRADPANPYADYTVELLHDFLAKYEPTRAPGRTSAYSNLGAGLLGNVLAHRAGMSYEQLLRERITGPLGMDQTAIDLTSAMKQRLAPPHAKDGSPASNWDIPTLAGAGGIRSTVDDLLTFLSAQLAPPEGDLGEAINLAWNVHWRPERPKAPAMGLGWHVARNGSTRWHNGGTGGYHSMMLASREAPAAVVVLCNTASFDVDRLAEDLLRVVTGTPVEPRQIP
jgi:CubicO group peptidase (beta-lactamase class C family)